MNKKIINEPFAAHDRREKIGFWLFVAAMSAFLAVHWVMWIMK